LNLPVPTAAPALPSSKTALQPDVDDARRTWTFGCFGKKVRLPVSLFLWKCLFVAILSYALIPLQLSKNKMPAFWYASILVALHVGILCLYFWRVRCSEFGKALLARLVGLAFTCGLLMIVVNEQDRPGQPTWHMYGWIAILCTVHAVILAILMAEVKASGNEPLLPS
jgi:hypothetical protein